MSSRLADRLNLARRRQFVGRLAEQLLFQSALTAAELPFYVLHVFGPGGIGKTTLLREFISICNQHNIANTYVDARDIDPTPESFLGILQSTLGLDPPLTPAEFLAAQNRRHVLFIDTYETLTTSLDRWLRQIFLPQLPDNILTVLAGRESPALAWRTDPGWQTLVQILPLRNLNPEESLAYLANHDIPPDQHKAILNFTHGHPLALSLVADMFAQRPDALFQLGTSPDIIKLLLERLVQKVPGPAHRTALEACAIVRITTEALLAEMLLMPDPAAASGDGVHELFTWLRGLSFIESNQDGLFPHDLIREVLISDLRWRNPDWYTELHRRARAYYARRLQQTSGQAQQRILSDYIFLHRDNPMIRPFYEWHSSDSSLPDRMVEADRLNLLAMIARHEGEASADVAAYWFERQPEGVLVFRDPAGQPAGLLSMVALHETGPKDAQVDPAIQAAQAYLQQRAPLRPGEKATFFRFWLSRDSYQDISPIQSLIGLTALRHDMNTPGIAFTFFPCAEPDFWLPVFTYANIKRIPEADFEVGGRRYGVYGHDWRAIPLLAWLSLLAEKETATEIEMATPPAVVEPLVVLSEPDFELAIRNALRDISRPELLRLNPLLRSRLVTQRARLEIADAERVATLQTLLKDATASLQAAPRELKLYRALYHTYLQPAPSQEKAAELLDIPFSTFRRHLQAGIAQVVKILWQQEIEK